VGQEIFQSKAQPNGKAQFVFSLMDSSGDTSAGFLIVNYTPYEQATTLPESCKKSCILGQDRVSEGWVRGKWEMEGR
jgi:hypothetical protein